MVKIVFFVAFLKDQFRLVDFQIMDYKFVL